MTKKEWKKSVKKKINLLKGNTDLEAIKKTNNPFMFISAMPSGFIPEIKYCYQENAHQEAKDFITNMEGFLFYQDSQTMLNIVQDLGVLNDHYLVDIIGLIIMSDPMITQITGKNEPIEPVIDVLYDKMQTTDVLVRTKRFGMMMLCLQKGNRDMFYKFYKMLPSIEERKEQWSEDDIETVQNVIHVCTLIACNHEYWDIARLLMEEQGGNIRVKDISKYINDDLKNQYKDNEDYDYVKLWVEHELKERYKYYEENIQKFTITPIPKEEVEKKDEEVEKKGEEVDNTKDNPVEVVIQDGVASVPAKEGEFTIV